MAFDNFSQNNAKTNVQFFSGPQDNLTSKIITGGAIEGAFYLTTDTHRLYVGRKVTGTNTVKAVQVSRGVTFVKSSGDLPATTSADIEEGELYYITTTNVLAALREKLNNGASYNPKQYEWIQINPPTGITKIEGNAIVSGTNDVIINSVISTDAGPKTGSTKFVAGSNVTLTPNGYEDITVGTETVKAAKMTIAATDTTYTVGTDATLASATAYSATSAYAVGDLVQKDDHVWKCKTAIASGGETWNADHWILQGAIVELRTNGQTDNTANTKVNILGKNSVAVTSDANGNVTVAGPTISAITVGARTSSAGSGFLIGETATDGFGNNISITQGILNPTIKYGQSGTTASNGVKFDSGVATLDIYTADETDAAISAAITDKLATANAMTYRGAISNYVDASNSANNKTFKQVLLEAIIANGGAHNGDVYKITGLDTTYTLDGKTLDVGDLLIISGTEETSGNFKGQILVGNTGVTGSGTQANPYVAANPSAYTADGVLALCDLVPSGDEPEVQAYVVTSSDDTAATSLQLRDGKNSVNTNILTTTIDGTAPSGTSDASKILVTSTVDNSVTVGKKVDIRIAHATTARNDATNGDKNNVALTANSTTGTDTLGTNQYTFYALKNGYSDLKTDAYGHVTGLQTSPITISHNKVTKLKTSYGINANSGLITIDREDSIGSTLADANKATIKLTSSTLSLVGNNTSGSQQLSIDLVWQTF